MGRLCLNCRELIGRPRLSRRSTLSKSQCGRTLRAAVRRSAAWNGERRKQRGLAQTSLETSPMTMLFLVIVLGDPVGEINFKGFALGSGAVLSSASPAGAFAPKSAPPGTPGTLPLLLLDCVGIENGSDGTVARRALGLRANAAALAVWSPGAVALATIAWAPWTCPNRSGCLRAPPRAPGAAGRARRARNQEAVVGYSSTRLALPGRSLRRHLIPRSSNRRSRWRWTGR